MRFLFVVLILVVCGFPLQLQAQNFYGNWYDGPADGNYASVIYRLNDAIRQSPTDAALYFKRGWAKFRANDLRGALADMAEAIRLNPNYEEAYNARGIINADSRLGNAQAALADFTNAVRVSSTGRRNAAIENVALFRITAMQDTAGALAEFDSICVQTHAGALGFCARAFFKKGHLRDSTGALADFNEAVRLQPNNHHYLERGMLRHSMRDFEGAVQDFQNSARLHPQHHVAFIHLGHSLLALGKKAEACEAFTKAKEFRPDLVDPLIEQHCR